MVFRKLPNLVSRQAKGATSNETANIQSSSDNESTLAYSLRSSPTAHNVLVIVVTKRKMSKRKMENFKSEEDKALVTTATERL